ncbi:hypothetical protein WISP_75462 [Willisornis vidua]|uniref:Uncharacterized protein n=1 Tax=Willisornis vidua TaxID=1566151 RepID=A0ABQ9DC71_9PASS|nr:hypothetical protein WISP_75462 [Willisornis vidua]
MERGFAPLECLLPSGKNVNRVKYLGMSEPHVVSAGHGNQTGGVSRTGYGNCCGAAENDFVKQHRIEEERELCGELAVKQTQLMFLKEKGKVVELIASSSKELQN